MGMHEVMKMQNDCLIRQIYYLTQISSRHSSSSEVSLFRLRDVSQILSITLKKRLTCFECLKKNRSITILYLNKNDSLFF